MILNFSRFSLQFIQIQNNKHFGQKPHIRYQKWNYTVTIPCIQTVNRQQKQDQQSQNDKTTPTKISSQFSLSIRIDISFSKIARNICIEAIKIKNYDILWKAMRIAEICLSFSYQWQRLIFGYKYQCTMNQLIKYIIQQQRNILFPNNQRNRKNISTHLKKYLDDTVNFSQIDVIGYQQKSQLIDLSKTFMLRSKQTQHQDNKTVQYQYFYYQGMQIQYDPNNKDYGNVQLTMDNFVLWFGYQLKDYLNNNSKDIICLNQYISQIICIIYKYFEEITDGIQQLMNKDVNVQYQMKQADFDFQRSKTIFQTYLRNNIKYVINKINQGCPEPVILTMIPLDQSQQEGICYEDSDGIYHISNTLYNNFKFDLNLRKDDPSFSMTCIDLQRNKKLHFSIQSGKNNENDEEEVRGSLSMSVTDIYQNEQNNEKVQDQTQNLDQQIQQSNNQIEEMTVKALKANKKFLKAYKKFQKSHNKINQTNNKYKQIDQFLDKFKEEIDNMQKQNNNYDKDDSNKNYN